MHRNRNSFTREEAFFLFCARLAYPQRIEQMAIALGYSAKKIGESYGRMLEYIWKSGDHLLCDFLSPTQHLTHERLEYFARKILEKGALLTTCWRLIDCTIRPISRPVKWQQRVYNGHKKKHSLKYSAVKSPEGLMYHCYGTYEGRRNNNHLLDYSHLLV